MRNLEKVWKAERAAEKEQQQMDLLRKEKIQEQSLEDLKKLQEHKSAGKNRYSRNSTYFYKLFFRNMVDWIYSGSTSSATPVSEDYLLGKKKPLLFEPKAKPTSGTFMGALESKGLSGRDAEAKAREDPLLLIRKGEQRRNNRGRPSSKAVPHDRR